MPESIQLVITEIEGLISQGRYDEAELLSRVLDRLLTVYIQYGADA